MKKQALVSAIAAIAALAATTGAFAQAATQDVNISATVAKSCTIGGAANPTALNATVPVSATGTVTTTAIPFTVNTVTCNTATNVLATSQSGGVKSASSAPAGFTNIIDYTGSANFGGVTSTINTSTAPAAIGSEAGNTADTGGAKSGDLTITVTPAQPASPLVAGTDYSDTLRVTLTPQ